MEQNLQGHPKVPARPFHLDEVQSLGTLCGPFSGLFIALAVGCTRGTFPEEHRLIAYCQIVSWVQTFYKPGGGGGTHLPRILKMVPRGKMKC